MLNVASNSYLSPNYPSHSHPPTELPEAVRDLRKEMAKYRSIKGTIATGGDREGQVRSLGHYKWFLSKKSSL